MPAQPGLPGRGPSTSASAAPGGPAHPSSLRAGRAPISHGIFPSRPAGLEVAAGFTANQPGTAGGLAPRVPATSGLRQAPMSSAPTPAGQPGGSGSGGASQPGPQAVDSRNPTYYGAAWLALGRVLLTTSALGGCAG